MTEPSGGHVAVLVNPVSGRGAGADSGQVAVERLRARGAVVRVYEGAGERETVELGRRAVEERPDVLVVVGGDGTVSAVLGPVLAAGVPLAVIPGGTGNDLAREHGIPLHDAAAAADLALDGARRRVDAGTVTAADGTVRHFVTVLCAGLDSLTNERTNRMTWPTGPARYKVAVYLEWLRLRRFGYRLHPAGAPRLDRDGYMLAVGLTRYYGGGVPICPDAEPSDGLLDVTLIEAVGRFRVLAFDALVKAGDHVGRPGVTTLRTSALRLEGPAGLVAYADGEPVGAVPLTVEAHREALTLCVPRSGSARAV
ncbi:diacylglycerol kinase family protein [Promicromonospora thailandica]|uniref:Diacylglycerol kinase (ATP) n=1 Tax=Promicromonospora thailandica TaxID=765201 RepID=A0A9X2G6R0_9MICO|nr:diacylglycerol kinase family protein [Promicromonospora thailandica]MCP2264249.1 diacylglycerol kinase (ATP) [Promicromonospora thailandica]BFF21072.1 diacylglycerol kinase [Promicromonospora thailandica]